MEHFAANSIFHLGFLNVTNTLLNTLLVDLIIFTLIFFVAKNLASLPGLFQSGVEIVIEGFYNMTESIAESNTTKIFPYFMTFFLFILIANWSGLIPGVGSIGFFEDGHLIPLIRGTTSDFNTTLALALVSAVATHTMSISTIGIKNYLSRYFSFNPINLFVGLLELVSEVTKVVSLSFRLFGNIFAGEMVLITVAGIFAFLFPIPFLLLEVIVGIVQALVFSMLTMVFMAVLATPHGEHAKEVSH
ncbi:MAG: F0F1 ATP synthase subunit A [Candidatus Levyibacteriota bacterium]